MLLAIQDGTSCTFDRNLFPEAAAEQLQGDNWDQLAEYAGRICYDSLGSGRNSYEYHKHIFEVGHFSIYEHCYICIESFEEDCFWMNRPGVFYYRGISYLNYRSLIEWEKWDNFFGYDSGLGPYLRAMLDNNSIVKRVMQESGLLIHDSRNWETTAGVPWISLLIHTSRAVSHELVRHGDFTAISQRSTRYCDEGETEIHPLLSKHQNLVYHNFNECLSRYKIVVSQLLGMGYTRKQARGAARCLLPHSLKTSLVFSAWLPQWKNIVKQRVNEYADAEICELVASLNALLPETGPFVGSPCIG